MEERSQQMIQEVGQVIMGKQDVVRKSGARFWPAAMCF